MALLRLVATLARDAGWPSRASHRTRESGAGCARDDLLDAPPLVLRQRPRLLDDDGVADLGGAGVVFSLTIAHLGLVGLLRALPQHRLDAGDVALERSEGVRRAQLPEGVLE